MPDALRAGIRNLTSIAFRPLASHRIELCHARTIFGASFAPDGWHHIVQTLREHDADPQISLERTTLYAFLKQFAPRTMQDWTGLPGTGSLDAFTYPWGWFTPRRPKTGEQRWLSRFCGPSTDDFIRAEYEAILRLRAHMQGEGYRPYRHASGFIQGTVLISREGERRFIVMQGNHRMAVLAHMGVARLHVRSDPRVTLPAVHESLVHTWPNVRNGLFTAKDAQSVFRHLFNGDFRGSSSPAL
jgi:hypothetical protein